MTTPPQIPSTGSDGRAFAKDLLVILGLPAILVGALIYHFLSLGPNSFTVPKDATVFSQATGTWDWSTSEGFCVNNPHTISFSPDHAVMMITSRRPWSDSIADTSRVAIYDISEHTTSYIRGAIRGESRVTPAGEPVVWDLILTSRDSYSWHRTDWLFNAKTGDIKRCPAGTDTLVAPVGDASLKE